MNRLHIICIVMLLPLHLAAQSEPERRSGRHIIDVSGNGALRHFNFCGQIYKLPKTCTINSFVKDNVLQNDQLFLGCAGLGFTFSWRYCANRQQADSVYHQFIEAVRDKSGVDVPVPVKCFLAGKVTEGVRVRYRNRSSTWYKLITYGFVNGYWVFVYLSSFQKKLTKNSQIHRHIRPVLSLVEKQ